MEFDMKTKAILILLVIMLFVALAMLVISTIMDIKSVKQKNHNRDKRIIIFMGLAFVAVVGAELLAGYLFPRIVDLMQ